MNNIKNSDNAKTKLIYKNEFRLLSTTNYTYNH